MDSLRGKTIKGIFWSGIERFSVQGVQVLVMLVIARILTPKDFGLVGMFAIFLEIAQSLVDCGFSQALIRKQNRSEADNSTVFYFNIAASCGLYLIIYLIAPWVAWFYDEPQLCSLMRVLCLIIIINSFAVVQRAIYTSNIDFRTLAKATFVATFSSGILGIYLAKSGYGVWALIGQHMLNSILVTILLWGKSRWRPHLVFSYKSFKELFSFGYKLLLSGLLNTFYSNIYLLVIGKIFHSAILGHYSQAERFAKLPSSNVTEVIQRVTYPILSSIKDEEKLSVAFSTLVRSSAFIIFPIMCALAGIAHQLITVLLGDKWSYTASLLIPLCFSMMWYPIHAINLNMLLVKGRSDLFLKLEIIKKILGISIFLTSIPFGLIVMCWSALLTSILCLFINCYYTDKLIHVSLADQFNDILPSLILSLLAFLLVFILKSFFTSNIISLISCLFVYMITFFVTAYIFHFRELSIIKDIACKRF